MFKWLSFIVVIVAASVLFSLYAHLENVNTEPTTTPAAAQPEVITVVHSYKDGIHRFSGEVKFPHSCYSVGAEVLADEKSPNDLVIFITSIDHFMDQAVCAEYTTRYPFQIMADGAEAANFKLEVDGVEHPIKKINVNWVNPNDMLVTHDYL